MGSVRPQVAVAISGKNPYSDLMTEKDSSAPPGRHEDGPFVRRVLIVAVVAVLVFAAAKVSLVLILTFGGVMVAVALRTLSEPLQRLLKIPGRWALLISTLGFAAAVIGVFDLFGTMAGHQFSALNRRIPEALVAGQAWLGGSALGRHMLAAVPDWSEAARHLFEALPLAGGVLGGIGEALLVFAAGIYFAVEPKTYTGGLLRLLPKRQRARAAEILAACGGALRKWLIGMSLDMLLMGAMVFVGMWLIGMPAPLALAVLSGAAVFVPYIGPAAAVVPGLLLALTIGPAMMFYAGLVYVAAMTIEGNLSQPMFQRWAASLPPVVNLLAILVFSPLFGMWGAVLATPLALALWVAVKMAYVEDVLQDRPVPCPEKTD
jgi:predicted PurR-regulated permease PerM